jgi:predicted metal-dependent peptidase
MSDDDVKVLCRNAVAKHAPPNLLLLAAAVHDRYRPSRAVDSVALSSGGALLVNPDFARRAEPEAVAAAILHLLLHLFLGHRERRGERDEARWRLASCLVVNQALVEDGAAPEDVATLPFAYGGPLTVDAVYAWLNTAERRATARAGPLLCAPESWCSACACNDEPADATPIDAALALAPAMADACGAGASVTARLLAPPPPRLDWRALLRLAVARARGTSGRAAQTYLRPSRRQHLVQDVIVPGWRADEPRLGILVDASGSMQDDAIAAVVAELRAMARAFPAARFWLASHTDRVCWQGWIDPARTAAVAAAVGFSGGTDPHPAYDALGRAGRFDAVVHFTDGLFFGPWPEPPATARWIIGLCEGARALARPPARASVIECTRPASEGP